MTITQTFIYNTNIWNTISMSKLKRAAWRTFQSQQLYIFKISPTQIRTLKTLPPTPKSCNVKIKEAVVTLNSGHKIPNIGLGTWLSKEDVLTKVAIEAVKIGYRMIDTAFVYENEKSIGVAIKELLKEGVIKSRQDLFITSKLWNTFHRPESVENAVRLSLGHLQLDYLDLYLMHWPTAYEEGPILFPKDACGNIKFSDVDYVDTWKAMEQLPKKGLTKSIGISNFNKSQLERLLKAAEIRPAVLQVECHPFLNQKKLMAYCKANNIAFTAYSPLGSSITRPYAVAGEERLLESKEIEKIAYRYQKSPAQVLIRYQIQRGNIVIPKSTVSDELQSNFQVFDWQLSDHHMQELDKLNKNLRYVVKKEEAGKHKYYPFLDEY